MDSKKRAQPETAGGVPKKRRTELNGDSHASGSVEREDEPTGHADLERFRKEAIYRRMKHYSRENERCQSRIADLERRKTSYETGLAAISACWTQLIEAIRMLTDDKQGDNGQARFDLKPCLEGSSSADIKQLVDGSKSATHELVTNFIRLGHGQQQAASEDALLRKCRDIQAERTTLKSEVDILANRLQESENEKHELVERLQSAENKYERMLSQSVLANLPPSNAASPPTQAPDHTNGETVKQENNQSATPEPTASTAPPDMQSLIDIVQRKETALQRLKIDYIALFNQKQEVDAKLLVIPEFDTHPRAVALNSMASRLQTQLEESQSSVKLLTEELAKFSDTGAKANVDKEIEELRRLVSQKDEENHRLRNNRDQVLSESRERKHLEAARLESADKFKLLSENQAAHLSILKAQNTRLKTQLVAQAGNETLMELMLEEKEDIPLVAQLQKSLESAQRRAKTMEQAFERMQKENPSSAHQAKELADTLEALADVRSQLDRYKSVYGDSSSLFPDASELNVQLNARAQELYSLKLRHSLCEQEIAASQNEVDRISVEWEKLETECKDKIYNLSKKEGELQRALHERGKSDNRYFAALREKEASEKELKRMAEKYDKQATLLDHSSKALKHAQARVVACEAEIAAREQLVNLQEAELTGLRQQMDSKQAETQTQRNLETEFKSRLIESERRVLEARGLLDEARNAEKDAKAAKQKVEERMEAKERAPKQSTSDMEQTLLKIIKCSVCKKDPRATVITKCGHSFCKKCIDDRLASRQRKCPSCGLGFAQSDAVPLFLQ